MHPIETIKQFIGALPELPGLRRISDEELKTEAQKFGRKTIWSNVGFTTIVRSCLPERTVTIDQDGPRAYVLNATTDRLIDGLARTLADINEYLRHVPMVRVRRTMGCGSDFTPECNLYVSLARPDSVRLAFLFAQTLFDPEPTAAPVVHLVCVPEWPAADRQIIIVPPTKTVYLLGTDNFGEIKRAMLRMAVLCARDVAQSDQLLPIEAGAKIALVNNNEGERRRIGVLFVGPAGSGKTTHTCHHHFLNDPDEEIEIIQDDLVFLKADGQCVGMERGFYVQTHDLSPESHPVLHQAVTRPRTVFENVLIDFDGQPLFSSRFSADGRAIVQTADFAPHASANVNMPEIDKLDALMIFFLTVDPDAPYVAARLAIDQVGDVFRSSRKATSGSITNEMAGNLCQTLPLVGERAEEDEQCFVDFLARNMDRVSCFLLNTGARNVRNAGSQSVSERIPVAETARAIRTILRGTAQWKEDTESGYVILASSDE